MGRGTGGRRKKTKDWELEEMLGDCGGQTQGHLANAGGQGSFSQSGTKTGHGEGNSAHSVKRRGLPVAQMKFKVFVKKSPGA